MDVEDSIGWMLVNAAISSLGFELVVWRTGALMLELANVLQNPVKFLRQERAKTMLRHQKP